MDGDKGCVVQGGYVRSGDSTGRSASTANQQLTHRRCRLSEYARGLKRFADEQAHSAFAKKREADWDSLVLHEKPQPLPLPKSTCRRYGRSAATGESYSPTVPH